MNYMMKKYDIVKTKWEVVMDPEFYFLIQCPNKKCNNTISEYELLLPDLKTNFSFKVRDGGQSNRLVVCPYCNYKFKLQIKEVEGY